MHYFKRWKWKERTLKNISIAANCLLYSLMNADIQARETFSTHVQVKKFLLEF